MDSISVNKFRENLKYFVERVVNDHVPLKVTRRNGEDFVVVSAENWVREQEALYVLQSNCLVKQIVGSSVTHSEGTGYKATEEEMDEIVGV